MVKILNKNKYYLFFIILIALFLRFISINQSLWLDEATSAKVAKMGLGQIFNQFSPNDFHPPIYYLMLKYWSLLFGTSEIGLRSLSVLAGVATVFLIYIISVELKIKLPQIPALLLGTSGLHIYFSQEARMYVLASFFVSSAVYFFVKMIRRGGVGYGLGFGLSLCLAALTHYLTLVMIVVFVVVAKMAKLDKPWWFKFIASHIILAFFFALWLPIFIKQIKGGLLSESTSPLWWNILGKTSPKEVVLLPIKFIFGRINVDFSLIYALLIFSVGALFAFLIIRGLKKLDQSLIVPAWLFLPIIFTALLGFLIPVFSYFRLLFVLPAFYLILTQGIDTLKKKYRPMAVFFVLLVNLVSTSVYLFNPKFHREDWKGLVNFISKESIGKRSTVLFVANSQMEAFDYYAKGLNYSGPAGLSEGFDQIWLMRYVWDIFDPKDSLRRKIEQMDYQKNEEYNFNGVIVFRYTK